MSQICQVTGRRHAIGHTVSHANKKAKRRFDLNLHYHRFWVQSLNKFVRLRVSARGMRIIDKNGIEAVLKNLGIYQSDIAK